MLRAPEVAGPSPLTQLTGEQHFAAAAWYVIQTKPHQEERVIAHLGLRLPAIASFLPKIEIVWRHAGRRVVHLEPLFPNYLFVWMPLTTVTWNPVRWAPGARRLLGDGERPIAVPDNLVDAIRERVQLLGFVRVGLNLPMGARVRLKSGPFAGLEGIFERPTSRRDRVRVLLEMLGALTPLAIDPLDLERV
jgi:transcriptional antiterminator RfaH